MNPVEMRHDDVDRFLGWLYRDSSPGPINDLLDKANVERCKPALNYDAARELCRRALQQTQPGSLTSMSRSSTGLVHMYLGSVYYAAGDLDEAIEKLGQASEEFRLHGRNQAVAEFSIGAAYAWQKERSQVYGHITLDVLNTLRYGMESTRIEEVNKKWEEIQSRLNDSPPREPKPPDLPSSDGKKNKQSNLRQYSALTPPNVPRELPPSTWERIVIPVAIFVTLVVGAILAYVLSNRNANALLGYVLAVSVATYLIVKRLACKAERDCALVIETGSGHKVRWGPTTYYRWPFGERVRALVPLYPLQYTTPAKSIQLGAKDKVDLRLMVYFRVDTSNRETHQVEENVLNSVYRVQLENPSSGDRSEAKPDSRSCTVDDLRRIWEKRLLKDITATMIEVLPGRTCDELAGQDVQARSEIIGEVRRRLAARVQQWGMEIGDMGVLDATTNKA